MSGSSNKPLVLVVEDDPAVRNLIATALDTHGYRHELAATGRAALASATTSAPDVILLDLGLPDMDGTKLIENVRGWSQVPIIVVSARGEDTDKIQALDAGADDYLTKPFSVGELLARVRTALRHLSYMREGGVQQESVFRNGDLSIDYAAGVAKMGDRELHLTPREYDLLCVLAKNVDKVLTHQYLLKQVWGTSSKEDLASLRVFMGTLRKKIEPDPSRPRYIQTHIGVGYRMVRV